MRQDVIAVLNAETRTRRRELAVVPPQFESADYSLVAANPAGEAEPDDPGTVN